MLVSIPSAPGYKADLETGEIWSYRLGYLRRLSGGIDTNGYRIYTIRGDRSQKTRTGHQLVCEAANGPKPDGMACRHRNGTKADNRAVNLAWGTYSENNGTDKRDAGSLLLGDRHQSSKLSEKDVREIRASFPKASCRSLASRFGVSANTIHRAALGKTWSHVK